MFTVKWQGKRQGKLGIALDSLRVARHVNPRLLAVG